MENPKLSLHRCYEWVPAQTFVWRGMTRIRIAVWFIVVYLKVLWHLKLSRKHIIVITHRQNEFKLGLNLLEKPRWTWSANPLPLPMFLNLSVFNFFLCKMKRFKEITHRVSFSVNNSSIEFSSVYEASTYLININLINILKLVFGLHFVECLASRFWMYWV